MSLTGAQALAQLKKQEKFKGLSDYQIKKDLGTNSKPATVAQLNKALGKTSSKVSSKKPSPKKEGPNFSPKKSPESPKYSKAQSVKGPVHFQHLLFVVTETTKRLKDKEIVDSWVNLKKNKSVKQIYLINTPSDESYSNLDRLAQDYQEIISSNYRGSKAYYVTVIKLSYKQYKQHMINLGYTKPSDGLHIDMIF
jgi:hypothetical protein